VDWGCLQVSEWAGASMHLSASSVAAETGSEAQQLCSTPLASAQYTYAFDATSTYTVDGCEQTAAVVDATSVFVPTFTSRLSTSRSPGPGYAFQHPTRSTLTPRTQGG
jgi:hypothetical protein